MSALFDYVINKKLAEGKNRFWEDSSDGDSYDKLNNAWPPVPSPKVIHDYQMQKIFQMNNLVLEVSGLKHEYFKELADLLIADSTSELPAQYENEQDRKINESIQKVFETISTMRKIKKGKNNSGSYMSSKEQHDRMQEELKSLSSQLSRLQSTLKIKSAAYEDNLQKIENAIMTLNKMKSLNNNSFNQFWTNISQIQGDLLEELGTGWFNERIPKDVNLKMVATGNISLNTSKSNRHTGQLIQDMLAIDISSADLDNVHVEYWIGENEHKTIPLRQFLDRIETYSGNEKIIINDNGYDAMLKLSALNVQAKSGLNQLPWNVNASTSVAISEYSPKSDDSHLSVLETFQLLYRLDTEVPTDVWVNNSDPNGYYQALANYGLATALYKVMHIDNYEGNQLLLTPKGFMTFSQRINEIFKKHPNGYISLNGQVFSNGKLNSLTTPYRVSIPKWILLAS